MAVHFHPLKISDVTRDTKESVIVTFDVPDSLSELFSFSQGQNITLRTSLNGSSIRRSYSICAAPFERKLSVAIKKAPGGLFSTFANETLKVGDTLEVLPPTGRFFTNLHPNQRKDYLAIAAGSGITPIISLIKATLATESGSTFTLIYGNRSRATIMFFEDLEALKNRYPARFNLVHILSREQTESPLNFGRIDPAKLTELKKIRSFSSFDEIFLCGPKELVFCTRDFLLTDGCEATNIHFELFTSPGGQAIAEKMFTDPATVVSDTSSVTIKLDGHSMVFDLPYSGDSILDGALKLGADLPFACKGGVCSTCRAKLLEGEVSMDSNYALEAEEIRKGFILTCQSHPLTSRVVIDFDTR